ncbi:uncharacterized protein LOC144456625 [Phascolarctos cinereus]
MDTDEEGGQLECQNSKELGLEGLSPREQESLKFLLDTIAALDGDGDRDRDRDLEALDSGQASVPDGPLEHKPLSTMPQPLSAPTRLRKFDTIVRSGISVRELRDHFRGLNQVPGTKETTRGMLPPRAQKPGLLPGHVGLAGTPSQVARVPKL